MNNSRYWLAFFQSNREGRPALPWDDPCNLTVEERAAVARSVQQFQLGEWARGRTFLRRGEDFAKASGDPDFVPALRMFIAEEQRHSADLGRFLDRERIPRLRQHWVDGVFRRARKLAGMELIVRVLVTAEILAVPFYRALHAATGSPLLRALCDGILEDEAQHLRYQGATLARLEGRSMWGGLVRLIHLGFLAGTAAVVWVEHRKVFARGGYAPGRVWREAMEGFAVVRSATGRSSRGSTSSLPARGRERAGRRVCAGD